MAKKKHRKKARSGKRAEHHIAEHGAHAKRAKRSKHGKRHSPHPKTEHGSLPLLRAIKRRRAAESGEHLEFDGMRSTHHHAHKKRGKSGHTHRSPNHHGEPVITEKSFENMLAYRRFQDHAR